MQASSDRAAIIAFTAGLHRTAIYRTAIVAFTSGLVISPLLTLTRRWWTLVSKRLSSAQLPPSAKDFAGIDCLVFDCDGVLYCGKSAVPGGPAALTALRQAGKQLLFVTNAAAVSRAGLAAKLTKMGYVGIEAEHCVTSASAAALHLHTTRPDVKTAYVIGGGGLVEELSNVGIASVGPGTSAETDRNHGLEDMVREGWSVARDGAAIGAVVCGALSDGLGYACLGKAAAYARDPRRVSSGRTPPCSTPRGARTLSPLTPHALTFTPSPSRLTPHASQACLRRDQPRRQLPRRLRRAAAGRRRGGHLRRLRCREAARRVGWQAEPRPRPAPRARARAHPGAHSP